MDESEKSGSDDKNLVMPELLDDSSDSEDESWDSKARYGLVRGRNHPDQISLRVEYDRTCQKKGSSKCPIRSCSE